VLIGDHHPISPVENSMTQTTNQLSDGLGWCFAIPAFLWGDSHQLEQSNNSKAREPTPPVDPWVLKLGA
jgi:hypothetical protein